MPSADRVYCTTLSEGVGDLELDASPFSAKWFMPPADLDGEPVDYAIIHRTQDEVETGTCVYDHPTLKLLRGAGTAGRSTAGEFVKESFSPGVKDVIFGYGAATINVALAKTNSITAPSATIHTTAFNATVGTMHRVDTTAGGFNATLPAAPADRDRLGFIDLYGSWTANPLLVLRNGKLIGGVADDVLMDRDVRQLVLIYDAATGDWVPEFTAAFAAATSQPALVLPIMLGGDTDSDITHAGPDKVVVSDLSSPVTYTVLPFSTSGIPLYSVINLDRRGTGAFTIAEGAGVTLQHPTDRTPALRAPGTAAVLYHDPLNTWQLRGELDEV